VDVRSTDDLSHNQQPLDLAKSSDDWLRVAMPAQPSEFCCQII